MTTTGDVIVREHRFLKSRSEQEPCGHVIARDDFGRPIYCGIPRNRHADEPVRWPPVRSDDP